MCPVSAAPAQAPTDAMCCNITTAGSQPGTFAGQNSRCGQKLKCPFYSLCTSCVRHFWSPRRNLCAAVVELHTVPWHSLSPACWLEHAAVATLPCVSALWHGEVRLGDCLVICLPTRPPTHAPTHPPTLAQVCGGGHQQQTQREPQHHRLRLQQQRQPALRPAAGQRRWGAWTHEPALLQPPHGMRHSNCVLGHGSGPLRQLSIILNVWGLCWQGADPAYHSPAAKRQTAAI